MSYEKILFTRHKNQPIYKLIANERTETLKPVKKQ
jgi:hypothetical protein